MKRTKRGSRCSREVNEARLGPDVHPVQGKLSLAKVIPQPMDGLRFHVSQDISQDLCQVGAPKRTVLWDRFRSPFEETGFLGVIPVFLSTSKKNGGGAKNRRSLTLEPKEGV